MDGCQSKLNVSVYLKSHCLGFIFSNILIKIKLSFRVMARFAYLKAVTSV